MTDAISRTEAERRNNVIVVREDQGEGYEGYGRRKSGWPICSLRPRK